MNAKAIYPGTFDPLTLGHVDLIHRAAGIFDRLILAVSENEPNTCLFSFQERLKMASQLKEEVPNLEVKGFNGLLMDFMHAQKAKIVVRGLRAFSDFEYEFQMALTNRKIAEEVETLFLMPNESYSYISSSLVREIASLGGDASKFVPPFVVKYLQKKFSQKTRSE